MLNPEQRARALEAYKKHYRLPDDYSPPMSEEWLAAWELATQQAQGKGVEGEEETEKLRKALRFYSDADQYRGFKPILMDGGDVARKALAKKEKKR